MFAVVGGSGARTPIHANPIALTAAAVLDIFGTGVTFASLHHIITD
ncbi:MAG: hypothetical protein M3443_03750 [Actinomycetota bacterium]|nr:hypothetical protein [Actinomycetota bacterium]